MSVDIEAMFAALHDAGGDLLGVSTVSAREAMALAAVGLIKEPQSLSVVAALHGIAAECRAERVEDRPMCLCCLKPISRLGLVVALFPENDKCPIGGLLPTCDECEATTAPWEIRDAVLANLRANFFPSLRRLDAANVFTEGGTA